MEGKGWVHAEDLQVGDDIRNASGETGEVEAIESEQVSQEMYNLTVDEAHTFFVGDGQWLVHNAGICPSDQLIGATGRLYNTQNMHPLWKGWDARGGTKYLDESARNAYEVFVYRGKLVDTEGFLLGGSSGRNLIAVMDPTGHIFAGQQSIGYFHHSSFLAGEAVSYAGHIEVKEGVISVVTAKSGHYIPPYPEFNNQLLTELKARGVNILPIKSIPGF